MKKNEYYYTIRLSVIIVILKTQNPYKWDYRFHNSECNLSRHKDRENRSRLTGLICVYAFKNQPNFDIQKSVLSFSVTHSKN